MYDSLCMFLRFILPRFVTNLHWSAYEEATLMSPLSVDISKDGPMNLWSATTAPVTEEILTAPWMCPEQKISPELVVMFKDAVLILWTWTEPVSAVTWQKSHSIKSDTSTLASSRDATLTLWTTGAWKKVGCKYIHILDMVVGYQKKGILSLVCFPFICRASQWEKRFSRLLHF